MDRDRLFKKLDIDSAEDFQYYESFDALMEEDEHIEEELLKYVVSESDKELLANHVNHFFDSFLSNIPDDETELTIIVETFKNNISNLMSDNMGEDEVSDLAAELYGFRRWYVIDHNAFDETEGKEISVRDARYEIMAAKFLNELKSIDFGKALTNGPDAYSVKLRDIIGQ